MFQVKRRIKSIRDLKKQPRAHNGPVAEQSSSVPNHHHHHHHHHHHRGILKSDHSCRSSQSPNSHSLWASNSSPGASAAEDAPSQQPQGASTRSQGSGERHNFKKPRRVNFDSVRIREYERTLGDNPSCSSGAPITLGWSHGKESKMNLYEYESIRKKRRNQRELTLSRMDREDLLLEWGATFNEIIDAIRANVKIKHQRRRTVNSIGTYDKWEEAMERAGRKLKKTLLPQKGSGSNKNGKNATDQKHLKTSASDSPVSSISSEPVAGNTAAAIHTSEDSSQTTIRRAKTEDRRGRSDITAENSNADQQASSGVPVLGSRESFSSSRPTPLIEIRAAPSCGASAMSVLDDDFDEDGYDDFEDLLDPYITDEGDRMYPPEIHLSNGHGDYDAETLTGSYAGYSMHSAEGFETLARDHSHWRMESGSTNSGPKVRPVFNPVTIYEDGPDDPGQYKVPLHYQSVDLWQRAGFQVQPPPHSSSLTTHWE